MNDKDIIYNPPLLTQYIADLLKAENSDVENVKRHINKEKSRLKKSNQNKVLISREIMSVIVLDFTLIIGKFIKGLD